ncbi:MAG: hypothetical protein AAGG48_31960, partial [Planctomycetota bacterium]
MPPVPALMNVPSLLKTPPLKLRLLWMLKTPPDRFVYVGLPLVMIDPESQVTVPELSIERRSSLLPVVLSVESPVVT